MTIIKKDKRPVVMIVDDTTANLEVLEEMLYGKGYRVAAFPRGEMALRSATQEPPDLILLDIMMPGMDGFEVCRKLKEDPKLQEIPVIFISALNDTVNKVKAFTQGGVDYVSKPFHEEEVISRVGVHIELNRQKQEIKKLLSETLIGAIKALNELLALSCPQAYRKTLKIGQYVRVFSTKERLENAWMFEIAVNFSNLGNLVTPVSGRGQEMPTLGLVTKRLEQEQVTKDIANIIRNIPRLDLIANIIEKSPVLPQRSDTWRKWPIEILGGHLLAIASAFEGYMEKGFSEKAALEKMSMAVPGQFNAELLQDFGRTVFGIDVASQVETTSPKTREEFIRTGDDFQSGQVLAEDLITQAGLLILSKGTKLTSNLCLLLRKLDESAPFTMPIKVYYDG